MSHWPKLRAQHLHPDTQEIRVLSGADTPGNAEIFSYQLFCNMDTENNLVSLFSAVLIMPAVGRMQCKSFHKYSELHNL